MKKKWKIYLIVSVVLSVFCGVVATIMYVSSLFAPDDGMLLTGRLGNWWVIPGAFLVGFFSPVIAYILEKILSATEDRLP